MVIFELPSNGGNGGLRAASLGSCRVRNPLYVLRDRGELRLCDVGMGLTHSVTEALQTLRLVLGEAHIPDGLAPYIFETEATPPTARLARTLSGGVDAFLLEVCDDKQFTYGDVLLQQNFVSRNLVQVHHGALLAWYRELCLGRIPDEACVQAALEKLREGGFRHDGWMADLLRGVRLRRQDADEIARTLGELMAKAGGRWAVVGATTIPGDEGATMRDRRALNEKLVAATARLGAAFYDPTELIVEYGRARVLDAGGANINEYDETFYPILGEVLVDLVRKAHSATGRRSAPPPPRPAPGAEGSPIVARRKLADRVNTELAHLHRVRLDELGLEASGLYAHYQAKLAQGLLLDVRERAAFELIDAFLPPYGAYAVMRAGLGELALLLAASGRKVIAFEPNANRRAAIEAGALHLQEVGLLAPDLLITAPTLTPAGPLEGRTLGVGLDVAQVHTEAGAAPHLERARAFDALLIDPRLFIRLREDIADQVALAETLRSLGFDKRRDYPAEGLFWFHRSPVDGERRGAAPEPVMASGSPRPVPRA